MTALDPTARKWLQRTFGPAVVFDEPLARHTYFRVGGPADAMVTPATLDELLKLAVWLRTNRLPAMVIGGGTNLLVRDGGIRGVVISIVKCLNRIQHVTSGGMEVRVTAGGGARLSSLCRYAVDQGLMGMNFAAGIPGTVGGAVVMNAGTGHGCVGDVVEAVTVLSPDMQRLKIEKSSLNFVYRALVWPPQISAPGAAAPMVLEADFKLLQADRQAVAQEAERYLKERQLSQPTPEPSAGCFFKNPAGGKTAGQLIDMAGLKGRRHGDAAVSTQHANFIVNKGKATAKDILELRDIVRKVVFEQFQVTLETEVKIVGTSS